MSKSRLKVPSLQHLARCASDDPHRVRNELVKLATNGPTFSYEPLHKIVKQMLVFGTPYEQALECVRRVPRPDVREKYEEILPLLHQYFGGSRPGVVQQVVQRFYPVSRDLHVPFSPPLLYPHQGTLHLPWLSFWKSKALSGERLALFASIVNDLMSQDPDLDSARFEFLDFSAPPGQKERDLNVIPMAALPEISDARKFELLSAFAEGFRQAKVELEGRVTADVVDRPTGDESQSKLFDARAFTLAHKHRDFAEDHFVARNSR